MKTYQDIVKEISNIQKVEVKGKSVYVNGSVAETYKHNEVAIAVAEKVSYFIGV